MPLTFGYQSCLCLSWSFSQLVFFVSSGPAVSLWFLRFISHLSPFLLRIVFCFYYSTTCFHPSLLLSVVSPCLAYTITSRLALSPAFHCALQSAPTDVPIVLVPVGHGVVNYAGGAFTTVWPYAVSDPFPFRPSLARGFNNIGVGGGDEIASGSSTKSNAVSFVPLPF